MKKKDENVRLCNETNHSFFWNFIFQKIDKN